MSVHSIESNQMSTFTDCPGREKLPYGADYVQPMGSLNVNFDYAAYLRNMEIQLVEGQSEQGIDAGSGGTTGATQAIALDAGLAPEADRPQILQALGDNIYAYAPFGGGPHFSAGHVGLSPVVRSLMEGGRSDVLWDVGHGPQRVATNVCAALVAGT